MPKISVLIPAYNVENYICECIESVLTQDLNDFEVICVDDASEDKTLFLLREYEKKDSRIRVFAHDKNKGQACGRNLAYKYATGEYIYMLDADDKLKEGALSKLYRICKQDNLDVVGFETLQFMDDKSLQVKMPAKMIKYDDTAVMNGADALVYCMDNEVFSLSVPTFMIKHEYLENTGLRFVEGILHEDVGYIYELITRADRIKFVHDIYFLRRVRANSTMTADFSDRNIEGYIKSFLKSLELDDILSRKYNNPDFEKAVKKWRRDILGRIRQLYNISEEKIYNQNGGCVDETVRQIFNIIKLDNIEKCQTKDILGQDINKFNDIKEIYICATGQYAERAISMMASLDIVVKGVLVKHKNKNSFKGFPVYEISSLKDRNTSVVLSVSRYYSEEYKKMLNENGFEKIIKINF